MKTTFPQIEKFTPAVLEAHCKHHNITPEKFRLATLMRLQCEIGNLLDPATIELHPDYRETWEDAMRQVRLAIADE